VTTIPIVRRIPAPALALSAVGVVWAVCLRLLDAIDSRNLSDVGLMLIALAAGAAGVRRARKHTGALRRTWTLLGAASVSWGVGQTVWTWYEVVRGVDVPFPSAADIGYLGLPPLAAAALLTLPLAATSRAGRARTVLDGLMVASSLLLISWVLVLGGMISGGADNVLNQVVSLAYPLSDIIVITIVVYTGLRARQLGRPPVGLSLPLIGCGLVAFSVSDSGFVYLANSGAYSSGNLIDVGWFAGFALMLLAALRHSDDEVALHDVQIQRPLGTLLPYAAVGVALLTSVVEWMTSGTTNGLLFWLRTTIMVFLVARQVLTLLENDTLTKTLEQRVRQRTAELRSSEQRFAALVQHSSDLVTVVDRDGTISYQSESSDRVLGYPADSLIGRGVQTLLDEGYAAELLGALHEAASTHTPVKMLQSAWRHATGHNCRVEVTITNLLDHPAVGGLVLNTRDVTERVELEKQLTQQAFTDSLTGLPNRALFKDRLQHALTRRSSLHTPTAVYFLDLDGFKAVNDSRGHSAGDDLLIQVAGRLLTVVRPSDTVARLGGDEFAILVDDMPDDPEELAQRIAEAFQTPFDIAGEPAHVAASVGIAWTDEHTSDAEQLLRNADLAMYQAKTDGAGKHAVYDPDMHAGLLARVRLEADLRRAVDENQFIVHYQPMVSMRTGEITGVEALVRWQHPERGLVPPNDFIPLAESTGLIKSIGLWVLRTSCEQAMAWCQAQGSPTPLKLSVNVSARQLAQPDLADQVAAILDETGMPAERLTLEMTESVLIDNHDGTLNTLTVLRDLGIKLAIDDFGTGYSSLSYLHRFPIDTLKIDRSFVQRMADGGDTALISTILKLGQNLQLETVAEGIERPQELLVLRRQGCTTGQGFHFSPPVPAERLRQLLDEQGSSGPAGTPAQARHEPPARPRLSGASAH
jgi:diguanylate cyclase (GGDEF)-like protein/PAS domain S-box-containing protein